MRYYYVTSEQASASAQEKERTRTKGIGIIESTDVLSWLRYKIAIETARRESLTTAATTTTTPWLFFLLIGIACCFISCRPSFLRPTFP